MTASPMTASPSPAPLTTGPAASISTSSAPSANVHPLPPAPAPRPAGANLIQVPPQALGPDVASAALAALTERLGDGAPQGTIRAMLPDSCNLALLRDAAEQLGFAARVAEVAKDGTLEGELLGIRDLPALVLLDPATPGILIGVAQGGDWQVIVPGRDGILRCPAARREALVLRERRLRAAPEAPRLTLRRLLRLAMPFYARAIVAGGILGCLQLATPFISMTVYNRVLPVAALESLVSLVIGGVLLLLFDGLFRMLKAHYVDRAADRADLDVNSSVFQALLALPMHLRPKSTGQATAQVQDLESVRSALGAGIMGMLIDLPFLVAFLIALGFLSWQMVPVLLLLLALTGVGSWLLTGALRRAQGRLHAARMTRATVMNESVRELEEIKLQGLGPVMSARHARASESVARSNTEVNRLSSLSQQLGISIQKFGTITLLGLGAYLVTELELTIGALVAIGMLGGNALATAGQLPALLPRLVAGRQAWNNLMRELRDQPSERSQTGVRSVGRLSGSIELQGVRARPDAQSPLVLNGLDLQIDAGERVAVIGGGGAGKTSLIRAICGLLDVVEGQIRIGGHGLDQVAVDDVRSVIGLVPQHPAFVSGTLYANLVCGQHIARDRVAELIHAVGAEALLLGDGRGGLDREVQEGGRDLSGSQRRLAALVRALLRDPEILLLDEPSSNLDPKALEHFAKLLADSERGFLGRKPTIILVEHLQNAALLKHMPRWVVLHRGALMGPEFDGSPGEVAAALKKKRDSHQKLAVAAANRGAAPDSTPDPEARLLTRQVDEALERVEDEA